MFNTDYDSGTNKIGVLDAVAEFTYLPSSISGPAVFSAQRSRESLRALLLE